MDNERESGSRFFFTDFEAYAKDRPPAGSDGGVGVASIIEARLPTMNELAGSLDISFEEDWKNPPDSPATAVSYQAPVPAAVPPPPQDHDRFAAAPAEILTKPASTAVSAPPLWSEYIGFFRQPKQSEPSAAAMFSSRNDTPGNALPPEIPAETVPGQDADVAEEWDILSLLTPPAAEVAVEEEAADRYPSQTRPYGDLTRIEDRRWSPADWYEPPVEMKDASSHQPPPDWYEPPAEMEDANSRRPPPADWYEPPAEMEDANSHQPPADWYEPPAEMEDVSGRRPLPTDRYEPPEFESREDIVTRAFAPGTHDPAPASSSRRFIAEETITESASLSPTPERREPPEFESREDIVTRAFALGAHAPASTSSSRRFAAEDFFSPAYLDKIWEERTRQKRKDREAESPTANREMTDLFFEFDIESAWESRTRGDSGKSGHRDRPGVTLIVNRHSPADDGATLIIPRDRQRQFSVETPLPSAPLPESDEVVLHFSDDKDSFAELAAGGRPMTEYSEKPRLSSVTGRRTPPTSIEELDITDLLPENPIESEESETTPDSVNGRDADLPDGMAGDPELAAGLKESAADLIETGPGQGNLEEERLEAAESDRRETGDESALEAPPFTDDEDDLGTEYGNEGNPEADDDGMEEAEADDAESAPVLDPMAVFSDLENADFSDDDGLDDEMRAMLEDEEEEPDESAARPGSPPPAPEPMPADFAGRLLFIARKMFSRTTPTSLFSRLVTAIAWRENWWFYCDLLAAIIASASLAVIVSYYAWYNR
ncbi:MAG: hypothetical protein FWG74_01065 [Planctomycetes bacterium]|nr:hypothetical protein [Planctomycetota bacterium]